MAKDFLSGGTDACIGFGVPHMVDERRIVGNIIGERCFHCARWRIVHGLYASKGCNGRCRGKAHFQNLILHLQVVKERKGNPTCQWNHKAVSNEIGRWSPSFLHNTLVDYNAKGTNNDCLNQEKLQKTNVMLREIHIYNTSTSTS